MRALANPARFLLLAAAGFLSACASAPLVEGGALSSYDSMKQSDGMVTKARVAVNKEPVMAAKTVSIVPADFSESVAPKLSDKQRQLVANSINRALCVNLSDRFKVVTPYEPADLTVRASVTQVKETGQVAAGLSAATSLGMSFIDTSVPIPTPRIPIGMGSLSIEAEAIDRMGQQQASMLWAKGANAFFGSPRASKVGDAYELADAFGEDFGELLVKGKSPFGNGIGVGLPSWQKIKSTAGLPPKYAACEQFGRYPAVKNLIGGKLGLPPEWTDKGAAKPAVPESS